MRDWYNILTRFALTVVILFSMMAGFAPRAVILAQESNLLQNGGFEGAYVAVAGDPSLKVAPNWQPWSLPPPPGAPSSVNLRPDYQPAPSTRVRSGNAAQEYNTFFATHDGGVYQRVPVTVGAMLEFSAHIYVWSSATFENPNESIQPQDVEVRVGIDPTGGQDGDADSVIWSTPATYYDEYRKITITGTAESNAVTVFVRSAAHGSVGVNNVYVDDASLIKVGSSAPTGPSPTPEGQTGAPSPTATRASSAATSVPVNVPSVTPESSVAKTATPRPTAIPDAVAEFPNRLTYTVQAGDTVLGIAVTYLSSVEAIIAANNLNESGFIVIGQRLVIPVPTGFGQPIVTPTPLPTVTRTPSVTPTPQPAATQVPATPAAGGTTAAAPGTHIVQSGENLFRIALRYNTTVDALAALNNITNPNLIIAGSVLQITAQAASQPATAGATADAPGTHTVRPGDNAYRISLQYGITVEQLVQANGLANPNLIFVGQTLTIPQ